MKNNIKLILTILIVLGFSSSAFAASLSINSSLPAPVGNVKFLKLLNNAFVEGDTCNPGELGLVNYTLYICGPGGIWTSDPAASVWTQSTDNIYLTDTSNPTLKRIGIGTSAPVFKLTLDNDGAILARGTYGSGDAPAVGSTASGAGTRFMWIPSKAAIRAGYVDGTQWNNANLGNYSVAFGSNNKTQTEYSSIGGGLNNSINANGGTAFDGYGVISGGRTNSSSSNDTVIAGGNTNSISTGAQYSVISGGFTNAVGTNVTGGTISGGWNNIVNGAGDTIGGGYENAVNGGLSGASTIAGGYNNTISSGTSNMSTISGGSNNVLLGPYNNIGGGDQNNLSGVGSVIGGGVQNQVTLVRNYATVGGGLQNVVSGNRGLVGGGSTNNVSGDFSAVLGGENNTISGAHSTALGNELTVNGDYSVGLGRGATINGNGTLVFSNFDYLSDLYGPIATDNAAIFMVNHLSVGTSFASLNPTATLTVGGDQLTEGNTIINGTLTTGGDATIGGSLKATLRSIDEIGMDTSAPIYYDLKGGTNEFGYDIAELFDAREEVEIADLVEVSDDPNVSVQKTQEPYSTRVVGVVSIAPAILFEGKDLQIAPKPGEFIKGKRPPVALAGRVLVKVSNENGAIERGDLLVSSSTPGHAMKGTNRDKMMGTVVGKALEPFEAGKGGEKTGTILMIVNLQ